MSLAFCIDQVCQDILWWVSRLSISLCLSVCNPVISGEEVSYKNARQWINLGQEQSRGKDSRLFRLFPIALRQMRVLESTDRRVRLVLSARSFVRSFSRYIVFICRWNAWERELRELQIENETNRRRWLLERVLIKHVRPTKLSLSFSLSPLRRILSNDSNHLMGLSRSHPTPSS